MQPSLDHVNHIKLTRLEYVATQVLASLVAKEHPFGFGAKVTPESLATEAITLASELLKQTNDLYEDECKRIAASDREANRKLEAEEKQKQSH